MGFEDYKQATEITNEGLRIFANDSENIVVFEEKIAEIETAQMPEEPEEDIMQDDEFSGEDSEFE